MYIAPRAVHDTGQQVRIDVYSFDENGKIVTLRKGKKLFSQKTEKDKQILYSHVYDAWLYYYNKLNKNE